MNVEVGLWLVIGILAGMQWAQVDWAPGCVAVCRDRDCDPERELQADEVRSIAAYVARVAALARAGL